MIDMSSLYSHKDYNKVLTTFDSQTNGVDCIYEDWKLFIDVHMSVSKNRCPICESPLDDKFFNLALAIDNMDEFDFFTAMVEFKNSNLSNALKFNGFKDVLVELKKSPNDYGFLSFLLNKQFTIN